MQGRLQPAALWRRGGMALLAVLALGPAAYLLLAAWPVLWDGGWLVHFVATTLPHQALTSLQVAVEAAVVAFAAGALPALVVSRYRVRSSAWVTALALLPLLFAPHVVASTWTALFSDPFFSSRHALALALGLCCAPYLFIVFRIAASRIPRGFGELAAALGHGRASRLWRVHGPGFAVPAAAGLLIVFAQVLGDYGAAERVGIPTLSVGIHNLWFASQSSQVAAVVSSVLIAPALLLVVAGAWASTRIISQNPVTAAAQAVPDRPLPRPAAAALLAWCAAWAVPGFVVPEMATVRWAWLNWQRTRVADIPADALQSAATASLTVCVVLAVCVLCAMLLRPGAQAGRAERVPWLLLVNYFLPTLVLALAFVMMSRDGSVGARLLGPWRDSRLLIVAAEALRFMPLALLPALDALARTPPGLVDAARACGSGVWGARRLAFAAQLQPALVLGCALVFIECVKELELSLTLQHFGYSSLALKIYAFSRHQNMDRAAAWVLLSQALMLLPLLWLWWRMERLSPRHAHEGTA